MIGNQIRRRLLGNPAGREGVPPGRLGALRTAGGAPLAEYITRFSLSFILSGASIVGKLSPCAAGFVAASGGGAASVASLAGAALGYLVFGTFVWAIKYIAIALIVCTVSIVFRDTELYAGAWFMPAAAGFIALCIGFVSAADGGLTAVKTALMFTDAALTGGCAYFYRLALSPFTGRLNFERGAETAHTVSLLILLSAVLISLSNVTLFGVVSVGRAAASVIVFFAAYKGGVGMGCASGVAVGLAMDSASGAPPIFGMAYGLAGLVAGIFSKRGKFAFTLAFILVDAGAALMAVGNAGVPAILYEVFIASVVFMVTPHGAMSRLGALLPDPERGSGVLKAREYAKNHVDQASLAFRELYDTVRSAAADTRETENIAVVFDRAADAACRKCARSHLCWQGEYQTTLDVLNNLTPAMQSGGRVELTDFPGFFAETCLHLESFIAAVNAELRAFLYRRQLKNRLQNNQNAAFSQYSEVSSILSGISRELGGAMVVEAELETRLKKYLQSLGLQTDIAVFRDRGGRLHAEVSGASLSVLRRDREWLEKLSAVLGVRLCSAEDRAAPDRLILLEAEPLAATVGISCLKKNGQEVSGDRGAYFKTDEGVLYVLLSDGMGSGEGAAKYSGDAVRILERFLRSGVAPEASLRMLNGLMLLKNEGDTGFATVDLVCINLFTGKVEMLKYGAAPSYLRSGAHTRRVKGKSLAAGLGAPPLDAPDHVKMELRAGSLALMVSDGVAGGGEDGWLVGMIDAYDGRNPRELSAAIVDLAAKKSGCEDDITAIAIQLETRE
ncbi:MAG: SpoIIE family protein phosphatase [Oscillospiraceae bacterium]|nr:SpoIIE family protein phosphatase [Oscillospiraceae bacterium]